MSFRPKINSIKFEHLDSVGKIDMDKLKKISWLYDIVKYYLPDDGTVDVSKIPVDIASRLDGWLVLTHEQPPKLELQPEPYVDRFREETRELIEREGQRIRDERAAAARIEYWKTQGLLDNERNANALTKFIEQHPVLKGRVTAQAIDVAVDFLGATGSNTLQWQQQIVPSQTSSVKPVRLLPNGEPELSLSAMETDLRRASKEQIKDWIGRKRQQS